MPDAIDLEVVRQMLPTNPYGTGVREIRPPVQFNDDAFERMLMRDPNDHEVWGIAYNGKSRPERQRFTIAHELGHFILHRSRQQSFNCDKQSVHTDIDTLRDIEREADDFASNLLMPGDLLRAWISSQRIDFRILGDIAKRFQVSLEALCIRYIKFTTERAILVYWDNGYVKYEWRSSSSAVKTRARIRHNGDPVEPPPGTLAADASVEQERDGVEMSAAIWCPEEAQHMKLREFKHTYSARDRVLTLLLLESAEPRSWDRSWQDEESFDSFDQFVTNGQLPDR
ncbi:ImmA/IrrE family metallo-endopeptidase [Verminephrobacter eiseniae]|nr:ImmA/IrrE family metallo-endopeptidase [Verminephrobacter eiseniae]MCW5295884.1 ImmA/IrrE family metallo-endopeptidase [Verminephrobacter eiseniae]MCW8188073.1 ImmA/IrrE family metallo-endopeptidase [Verminephrobacter eiseniae]MCW8226318.1 ImmA/IrrE family metallo-endopeptidase [Verminephrobacter eiseniae]MCW8237174.1 ImmA/IrrE family metallo-endopeptidase [Verminephrobacter eiseniae]